MLPHQLMKSDDFHQHCGYCSKKFDNCDEPLFTRFDGKEYLVFHCASGHEQSMRLDIGNIKHQKWIEEDILKKYSAKWKQKIPNI